MWETGVLAHEAGARANSLFPNPGRLRMPVTLVQLPRFDARAVALAPFKARLVHSMTPWLIGDQVLHPRDDYRLVAYTFEAGYAEHVMGPTGTGLFLEQHAFAQTISPLTPASRGWVTLARWLPGGRVRLVAVHIPWGWTLIVQPGCIHGDATLVGRYLMAMTSDHTSMSTADTVYLRGPDGVTNTHVRLSGATPTPPAAKRDRRSLVLHGTASRLDRVRFARNVLAASTNLPVFNPTCWAYWVVFWEYLQRSVRCG